MLRALKGFGMAVAGAVAVLLAFVYIIGMIGAAVFAMSERSWTAGLLAFGMLIGLVWFQMYADGDF